MREGHSRPRAYASIVPAQAGWVGTGYGQAALRLRAEETGERGGVLPMSSVRPAIYVIT